MSKLLMRIGRGRLQRQGTPIADLAVCQVSKLLQRVAVLYPKRRLAGIYLQRFGIGCYGLCPVPSIPCQVATSGELAE